jgi:hypothetical protein
MRASSGVSSPARAAMQTPAALFHLGPRLVHLTSCSAAPSTEFTLQAEKRRTQPQGLQGAVRQFRGGRVQCLLARHLRGRPVPRLSVPQAGRHHPSVRAAMADGGFVLHRPCRLDRRDGRAAIRPGKAEGRSMIAWLAFTVAACAVLALAWWPF